VLRPPEILDPTWNAEEARAATIQPLGTRPTAGAEVWQRANLKGGGSDWKWLDATCRERIDTLELSGQRVTRISVVPTGWPPAGAKALAAYYTRVQGASQTPWPLSVQADGRSIFLREDQLASVVKDGVLTVALHGDFARHEPTVAQLESLAEVIGYVRLKVGILPLTLDGATEKWLHFPSELVLKALNAEPAPAASPIPRADPELLK
jgi:hypothetical protein